MALNLAVAEEEEPQAPWEIMALQAMAVPMGAEVEGRLTEVMGETLAAEVERVVSD